VYCSDQGGVITVFTRSVAANGKLTYHASYSTPERRTLARLLPTSNAIYAAMQGVGIAAYSLDRNTGALSPLTVLQHSGTVQGLVINPGTNLLFAGRNDGNVWSYTRVTACGVGVPEPCESPQPPVPADLVCTISRLTLQSNASSLAQLDECSVNVVLNQDRGFECTTTKGVLMGIDRLPIPIEHQDHLRVLSFYWRDNLGRGLFATNKQGPLVDGFNDRSEARLSNTVVSPEFVLSLYPQAVVTACLRSECCVIRNADGGSCTVGSVQIEAVKTAECQSGWTVTLTYFGDTFTSCFALPVEAESLVQYSLTSSVSDGDRSWSWAVAVNCAKP